MFVLYVGIQSFFQNVSVLRVFVQEAKKKSWHVVEHLFGVVVGFVFVGVCAGV